MKKETSYIKIWRVLGDGDWHDFTEICNPYIGGKEGDRRLRQMRQEGWVEFEWRYHPGTHTPQYRITKIYDTWWNYYRQFNFTKVEQNGQMAFV